MSLSSLTFDDAGMGAGANEGLHPGVQTEHCQGGGGGHGGVHLHHTLQEDALYPSGGYEHHLSPHHAHQGSRTLVKLEHSEHQVETTDIDEQDMNVAVLGSILPVIMEMI